MATPPVLQAVLFDMDGLLVDTEGLWFDVESSLMAELGCPFGRDDAAAVVGGPMERTVRHMIERCGADLPAAELVARLVTGMAEALDRGVSFLPGAKDLLAEVNAAGVPAALVSSSFRHHVDAVLETVGSHLFAVTVSGDEVRHNKPDPDPYLAAACRMEVEPGYCVVLEDSPTGVASAEAAGCVTVAVPSVAPIPAAPGRTVLASLEDVDLARLRGILAAMRPGAPT
ncbi:MAG: HAD family hydrolase [Streptomycetales bacterium]